MKMGRVYNIHEALRYLMEYDITHSGQVLTRWLREGKIRGERSANLKEGWRIQEEDIIDFIRRSDKEWILIQHHTLMGAIKQIPFESLIGDQRVESKIVNKEVISKGPDDNKGKHDIEGDQINLTESITEVEKRYDQRLQELKSDFLNALNTHKEDTKTLIQKIDKLVQETKLTTNTTELGEQIEKTYETKFNMLKEQISKDKSEITDLKGEFDKLSDKMDGLNDSINNLLSMGQDPENPTQPQRFQQTYEEFVVLIKKENILPKGFLKEQGAKVKQMYDYYFQDGQLKEQFIIKDTGWFTCPIHHSINIKSFGKFLKKDIPNSRHLKKDLTDFNKSKQMKDIDSQKSGKEQSGKDSESKKGDGNPSPAVDSGSSTTETNEVENEPVTAATSE
jgi:hypothetical protein